MIANIAKTANIANIQSRIRVSAEFVAKIGLVAEEADESEFWLELAIDAKLSSAEKVSALVREAGELTAIFTASRDTAKRNLSVAGIRSHNRGGHR